MKMEFERISEELIKPSSPTPTHLKTYKFSLIDQFFPSVYTPFILFYPPNYNNSSHDINSSLLKHSLSQTLSLFYPLAGRLKDNLSIDCNDQGLRYTNARVMNISLSDFLNQPDLKSMTKLLPHVSSIYEGGTPGSYVSMVQETCFPCGGIALGLLISHMAMDGVSMASFLKAWAAICSGKEISSARPFVDASSMFPPADDFPTLELSNALLSLLKRGRFGVRRFVFEAADIDRLKAKAMSSRVENPTRVETVSALLCRCLKAARKAKSVAISYTVNFRTRFSPPLPEYSMGNFVWLAKTKMDEMELTSFVSHLRKAFRGVDVEFVKKMKDCDREFLEVQVEKIKEMGGDNETEFIGCTSWINFGVYEIDYGWGKPVWVSNVYQATESDCEIPFTSSISLMDANIEKGIEAFVYSMEEDLCVLEEDQELLSYASLNPNLLINNVIKNIPNQSILPVQL